MAAVSSRQSDDRHRDVRCHCGSLMARVTQDGIELKCRRCKRVVVVAAHDARSGWVAVSFASWRMK